MNISHQRKSEAKEHSRSAMHPSDMLDNSLASITDYRKCNSTPELFQVQLEAKVAMQKAKEYIEVLEQALQHKINYGYQDNKTNSIT
ncbi:hypothetical protein MCERE19_03847 [Spirosomataceae bacterium]|jgi:hypothetical protein